jgi:two-component system, chemotaxis family, sensor kinase Cph1
MEQLQPGDHAALFYRNRTEQFAAALAYIQVGLARNERCLYIAGDNSKSIVVEAMEEAGIDVAQAIVEGRLTVATPEQTYLRHGVFEPEKMVEGLRQEVSFSLDQGFSAFRGTGELGWAAALPSALLRLYEYEQLFDKNLASSFVALCQYHERLFLPEVISQMLRIHPKVVARGQLLTNPFYVGAGVAIANYPPVDVEDLLDAAATAVCA